jgi:cytochrome b subunit of formate dehydrogenase
MIAAIYSILVGASGLLMWMTYFLYSGERELLLPVFIFHFAALPSSLLVEPVGKMMPWVSDGALSAIVTGFAVMQAVVVWMIALRLGSSRD